MLIDGGYEVDLDDRRTYNTSFTFKNVEEDSFFHIKWQATHLYAGQGITLREHQVETINNFLANPQCIQEVATGAGKTVITGALSTMVEPYGRTIVIVPNKSLVTQTEDDYINMGLDCGVFYGNRKEYTKTHTICTWQSLNSLFKKSKAGEASIPIGDFLEDVVCVIVDEVHSAKADALKGMLTGPMSHIPLRWGLTGTVPKEASEYNTIFTSIGKVIGRVSSVELQKKGILANCHVNIKQLQDGVTHSNYQSELKYLLSDEDRLDQLALMIKNISATGNTLVLVDRVAAGKGIVDRLNQDQAWAKKKGEDKIVFVHGATKTEKRKEHYDEVANASDMVIVATYGVAAVGINIPRIFNLVLIEPGKSFVRVVQSIGRGVRVAEDKDFVQIYDITSSCKFAKRHLTQRKKFYREQEFPFKVEKIQWK